VIKSDKKHLDVVNSQCWVFKRRTYRRPLFYKIRILQISRYSLTKRCLPQSPTEARELLLPPLVLHAVKFARHFFLFFLLPIAAVVIAALLAATLVISVQRSLFARLATPEEVLEDALRRQRRNDDDVPTIGYPHGPSSSPAARHRRHREAALEALRGVPRPWDRGAVLARERRRRALGGRRRNERIPTMRGDRDNELTHRNQSSHADGGGTMHAIEGGGGDGASSRLDEWEKTIERGLAYDPTNESMLKLRGELRLVREYGSRGPQTRMMKVGKLDWME
jgi:hypothetical protein